MLTGLALEDWKSFGAPRELALRPVTSLVGPNASGKSNLIDALRFLQGCALGMSFADALRGRHEGQREVWPGIRGAVKEATRHGRSSFVLASEFDGPPERGPTILFVSISTDGEPQVKYESLGGPKNDSPLWYHVTRTTDLGHAGFTYAAVTVEGLDGKHAIDPLGLTLGRMPTSNGATHEAQVRAQYVHTALRELIFLDVQPHRMRDYRPDGGWHLGINAENISPILYRLGQEQPARLADVVDWLSELCGPTIESIDFDRTRLGETMLFLVERGGAKVSARSASDGTLRFLGLVAALLTVPEGSTLIMEEPDVGLHPSRLHLLASLFEETARARDLQIIATTHSPTLLAHLSPTALGDVLAFGRDPDTGCTVAKRVGDLPHYATLRDAKDLEHLISNGWLERAL